MKILGSNLDGDDQEFEYVLERSVPVGVDPRYVHAIMIELAGAVIAAGGELRISGQLLERLTSDGERIMVRKTWDEVSEELVLSLVGGLQLAQSEVPS